MHLRIRLYIVLSSRAGSLMACLPDVSGKADSRWRVCQTRLARLTVDGVSARRVWPGWQLRSRNSGKPGLAGSRGLESSGKPGWRAVYQNSGRPGWQRLCRGVVGRQRRRRRRRRPGGARGLPSPSPSRVVEPAAAVVEPAAASVEPAAASVEQMILPRAPAPGDEPPP